MGEAEKAKKEKDSACDKEKGVTIAPNEWYTSAFNFYATIWTWKLDLVAFSVENREMEYSNFDLVNLEFCLKL